jgi:predicted signal transduction protein with EAL and GGDEF domain
MQPASAIAAWLCCSPTWTASSTSTTPWATRPATSSCCRWPSACEPACATATWWRAPGGDEFVVVLDDLQEGSMPEDVAERILASLARPFELCSQQVTVTPSIGIALYPNDGNDGEALIKNADAAMYLAKERGRNNFQFFDHGLSARYSERLELENRLRHALDENQLELFYQPQVDTLSGELIGMEALIRWRQPDGSMIPPDKFIPIAEECGLIVPIGAWVLQEACRQVQAWLREGICRVPVGVNLSARQFDDAGLLDTIKSALADASLPRPTSTWNSPRAW